MSIVPQGEDIRKAVQWISDKRRHEDQTDLRKLIELACLKFNLSPLDANYLERFVRGEVDDPH